MSCLDLWCPVVSNSWFGIGYFSFCIPGHHWIALCPSELIPEPGGWGGGWRFGEQWEGMEGGSWHCCLSLGLRPECSGEFSLGGSKLLSTRRWRAGAPTRGRAGEGAGLQAGRGSACADSLMSLPGSQWGLSLEGNKAREAFVFGLNGGISSSPADTYQKLSFSKKHGLFPPLSSKERSPGVESPLPCPVPPRFSVNHI